MQYSHYTTKSVADVLTELKTSTDGLVTEEVHARQQQFGLNQLTAEGTHWWDILWRQFQSPFLYLLIGASLLAIALGEIIDGIMILCFVLINAFLGFYQEYRSEKTLQFLKQYVVNKTKVIRNKQETVIDSKELVPGDIIVLEPGNIVPADARVIETDDLVINESVLTGESVDVVKNIEPASEEVKAYYKATNICFSGTTVIGGKGKAVILNTGKDTSLGSITTLTVETKHVSSFEKGVSKFSRFILQLIIGTLFLIFLINLLLKGSDANIPSLIIFSIALAVSVIPEALPVVTTFSLSRGARHLAKHHVIVKRLSAIEDLGSIEVLCTDKTGTITENKLTVASVYQENKDTLLYGALATAVVDASEKPTDSFDVALLSSLDEEKKKQFSSYERLKELPFDPVRKRNSVLVKNNSQTELLVRGASERVIELCINVSEQEKFAAFQWIKEQGEGGKRVIALAKKTVEMHHDTDLLNLEKELEFIGLISFIDPIKKTAFSAIKTAEKLGVSIKILTGDSKEVAGSVAKTIGLIQSDSAVITFEEFSKLSISQQHVAARKYAVFARVAPDQKHKIIQLIKESCEVGFLGEGINDAPALKAASVAIVVQGASDIAREAADIILLNKSVHTIVDGIREGREIFANTTKYIKATLASNFGNFYTVAIASLLINFLPLLPLQILLLNLLTDSPMISVATDNVDSTDLKTPKNYDIKEIALIATVLGVVSSVFDFIFFVMFYRISPGVLQTNWFIGSVATELLFLFSIRTRFSIFKATKPAKILFVLSALALTTAVILPFTTVGKVVFEFVRPSTHDLLLIGFIAVLYFVSTEFVKVMYYRFLFSSKKNASQ